MKRLYIKTFGCQMNEYDSMRVARLLAPLGYEMTDDKCGADLIVLNTCSIRQKAEGKVYSMLGRLRPLKQENENLIIAVGGCVAQQEGKKLLGRMRHVSLVFGTKSVSNLPAMIKKIERSGGRYVDTGEAEHRETAFDDAFDHNKGDSKALITIIEGCNNFCAYCIVPHVRGRERSRRAHDILDEARVLVRSGVKEITLLGQNVNSYHDSSNGTTDFPALLRKVAATNGLERLRFVTSHPKDLTDELISCFKELPTLCNHIHLPVQAGSDRVLERMNRKYTRGEYLNKVDKLRKVCHNISISTDIIVGFPGESRDDFNKTMELVREVEYDHSYSFKFSTRAGTKAAGFDDDVSGAEKSVRLSELQALQKEIIFSKNKEFEGTSASVLVEGVSKTNEELLTGRTTCNRIVNFSGDSALVGKIVNVNITKAFMNSLRGEAAVDH